MTHPDIERVERTGDNQIFDEDYDTFLVPVKNLSELENEDDKE